MTTVHQAVVFVSTQLYGATASVCPGAQHLTAFAPVVAAKGTMILFSMYLSTNNRLPPASLR
jgi:hypothetical protein